jgi:hypothetical protein
MDTPRSRGDTDAPHESPVTPAEDLRTIMINRVAWGAIFAGVAIALVAQLLFSILGIGIGVASLGPQGTDIPTAEGFSLTAALWWGITGVIAAFLGGFTAGRLAGVPKESTAAWHGLTSWAVATLAVFYLFTTTVGSLIGGTFNTLSSAVGGIATTAGTATTAVSGGALLSTLALILGAFAAWFGGRAGYVEPTVTSTAIPARRT